MSQTVQLEAFESELRGRRLRWFITPHAPIRYPPGFQEQCFTESPPYQRRVLITSHNSTEAWKLMDKWDAVLIPQTAADWSLVLTVLLHQPSPKLALITPEVNPPAAFYTKAQQSNQQSLTIVFLQYLQMPLHASLVTFDATFFPPANKIDDIALEPTELALQQTLTQDQLYNFVLKDAIRDLKGAGATLVVSSIDDSRAQLYWYYASEHKSKGKDLLASVVQTLLNRET